MEIDFPQIVPRCGSKWEAFEELSCQIARKHLSYGSSLVRIRGAGGDGGVEAYTDLPSGNRVGLQAKYLFKVDALLTQATKSLQTALEVHPTLTRYIICFPFDLTGPTKRRGRSGSEKFGEWRGKQIEVAAREGRTIEIEAWPASHLAGLLMEIDPNGGIQSYFFDKTILTPEWFTAHLDVAAKAAGPRYTKELNVQTEVSQWFSAFGRTEAWKRELEKLIGGAAKKLRRISEKVGQESKDPAVPHWPDSASESGIALIDKASRLIERFKRLCLSSQESDFEHCKNEVSATRELFSTLERQLVSDLEGKHGKGRADSPGFRQFMAEYQVSFPAANLDSVREFIDELDNLYAWLSSPTGSLAFRNAFVLSGGWGVGKTHTLCDVAHDRLDDGLMTCVLFGHQFGGQPDSWTRLIETLGLKSRLDKDGLLDALAAAAEATDAIVFIVIDAINETVPRAYWHRRVGPMIGDVSKRRNLRICFSCRTPFIPKCLPSDQNLEVVEHPGFKGSEHVACAAFFEYYGLNAPVAPILQPELANPLYLRLVCETLQALGLTAMPSGWSSMAKVTSAFLSKNESDFAIEKEVSPNAKIITCSLQAIAQAMATSGMPSIAWSEAINAVTEKRPDASRLQVVDWLVGANLLIEEGPAGDDLDSEGTVRPSFERIGDYLVGSEILAVYHNAEDLENHVSGEGPLADLIKDEESLRENVGILGAISVLLPEKFPGIELPTVINREDVRDNSLRITIENIPWRDPESFSAETGRLLVSALGQRALSRQAMDAIVSVSWNPSDIDAIWLHGLLANRSLANRDSYWCGYLHESLEDSGSVDRLISSAFEMRVDDIDRRVAERWCVALLWFTAAADRRVKDNATRSATRVITGNPEIASPLVGRMLAVDDDEVVERTLIACYGALLVNRDTEVLRCLSNQLFDAFAENSTHFDHAQIRDTMRCIVELAQEEGQWSADRNAQFAMDKIDSAWPLQIPSESKASKWEDKIEFRPNEFASDFYKYSMGCLRPWLHGVSKKDIGHWIAKHVAVNLGYFDSSCDDYDEFVLAQHGDGRGRVTWAERIAKKYMWISLNRAASRLYDHVKRKKDDWNPDPIRQPLILLEERKLDPTLPRISFINMGSSSCWWIRDSVGLDKSRRLSDKQWTLSKKGLPDVGKLVSSFERNGQSVRLLNSHPTWGRRAEGAEWNDEYRNAWMNIHSYLVPSHELEAAFSYLDGRNLFGDWMPQAPSWLHGFVGEYPWATPFNTESDEWHGLGAFEKLDFDFCPTWSQIAAEWEYDASIAENLYINVPSKLLFEPSPMRWNGNSGFVRGDGRVAFSDPAVLEDGPKSLLADSDDLLERIRALDRGLIWTFLGEKRVLGGEIKIGITRQTYSQVAMLDQDDRLVIGKRSFYKV